MWRMSPYLDLDLDPNTIPSYYQLQTTIIVMIGIGKLKVHPKKLSLVTINVLLRGAVAPHGIWGVSEMATIGIMYHEQVDEMLMESRETKHRTAQI